MNTVKIPLSEYSPEIANQWHPTKNKHLTPDAVSRASNKKVWWLCPVCNYGWQATVASRTNGSSCPRCLNRRGRRKSLEGVADILISSHPTLAAQWHPTKNKGLSPELLTVGSNKKVWWLCEKGHAWEAVVASRTHGDGCPYCATRNARVLKGFNDLQTAHPEIAMQWHPTKNNGQMPSEFVPKSNKKAWWLCPDCGHEWQAVIASRTRGTGCPVCSRSGRPRKSK